MTQTMDMETFWAGRHRHHPLARIRARATINGKLVTKRWNSMYGWLVWNATPEAENRAAAWVVTVEEDGWEERWKERDELHN